MGFKSGISLKRCLAQVAIKRLALGVHLFAVTAQI